MKLAQIARDLGVPYDHLEYLVRLYRIPHCQEGGYSLELFRQLLIDRAAQKKENRKAARDRHRAYVREQYHIRKAGGLLK